MRARQYSSVYSVSKDDVDLICYQESTRNSSALSTFHMCNEEGGLAGLHVKGYVSAKGLVKESGVSLICYSDTQGSALQPFHNEHGGSLQIITLSLTSWSICVTHSRVLVHTRMLRVVVPRAGKDWIELSKRARYT